MRTLTMLLTALLLCSCQNAIVPEQPNINGQIVTPVIGVYQVSTISGEGTFGSLQISMLPGPPAILTYPMRWKGNARVMLQWPLKPHVVFEGDSEFVIEALPEFEQAVVASMRDGRFIIRSSGMAGYLSPPGTIQTVGSDNTNQETQP